MAHAHPASYYVRYLLLTLDDVTLQTVNKVLELRGLARVDAEQLACEATAIEDTPQVFRPWDAGHAPSARWLRAKRIHSLVHQDGGTKEMMRIVSTSKLRETVERMLIGNVRHLEVSYRLQKMGEVVGEAAVADFQHYFWNTKIMGAGDWAHYFRSDVKGRTRDTQDGYDAALVSGPQFALYRSGVKVEIDRKQVMQELHRELYFTFQEIRALPTSQKKVEMLATTARSLARVDERIDASDSALLDVLKKFEKFRTITDTEVVPSIIDIAAAGSFSDRGREKLLTSREKPT